MISKVILFAIMIAILTSLGSALYYLMKDNTGSERTVRTLSLRITLAIGLFLLLLAGYFAGFLHPHALGH